MSDSPIRRGSTRLPSRILLYAKPGQMKTTFGAFAPKPIFIMTPGETGLLTLLDYGRVPVEVEYFPVVETWAALLANVKHLIQNATGHKTLVIDVVNGAERLCHDFVCKRDFRGNNGSYLAFSRGPEQAIPVWSELFAMLDTLRINRSMSVIMLAHAKVKRFSNPEGDDFDKYQPDISEKFWQPVMRWADAIIFSHHERVTVKDGIKTKVSLSGRKFYCEDNAAFDAKNRMGLPAEIEIPDNPALTFSTFADAIKQSRARVAVPAATTAPTTEPATTTEATA